MVSDEEYPVAFVGPENSNNEEDDDMAATGNTFLRLIAIILAGSFASCAWAAPAAGTVKTLTGMATVTRDSSVLALAAGQRVFPGDRISTSPASYVGITLRDDTQITIGPSGALLIRAFEFNPSSYEGGFVVSFLKGTARVLTGIIGKHTPERVRFNTPTATIGIRGTDFIVDLEERK